MLVSGLLHRPVARLCAIPRGYRDSRSHRQLPGNSKVPYIPSLRTTTAQPLPRSWQRQWFKSNLREKRVKPRERPLLAFLASSQAHMTAFSSSPVARWVTRRIALCIDYYADDTSPEERSALMAQLIELHHHEPRHQGSHVQPSTPPTP